VPEVLVHMREHANRTSHAYQEQALTGYLRIVGEFLAAHPDLPIVGVGGVACGADAVELLLAGANAVQVGTATFADPRACERVLDELTQWCGSHGVGAVSELVGGSHR